MPTVTAFVLALLGSLALTPLARRLAWRIGAIDHVRSTRQVNRSPVPRLGGLAIAGAALAAAGAALLLDEAGREALVAEGRLGAAVVAGALAIVALGLRDDLRGVGPGTKLLAEFGAGGLLFVAGLRLDAIGLPLVGTLELGWLSLPATLLWVAGVTNAVNLVDGLDGLAAGVVAVAAGALGLIALIAGQPLVALLAAALAGSSLGFLRHNAFPATVFMGDTGSLFLGFSLAGLSLRLLQGPGPSAGMVAIGLALGIPLADTALAVARRALRAAPLFRADRGHLHHRLLARGMGHQSAVRVLWAASLAMASAAVLVAVAGDAMAVAVLATLAVAGAAGLWWLGLLHPAALGPTLAARRRNLARRAGLGTLCARLRGARDHADVWAVIRASAEMLGAAGASYQVPARPRHPSSTFDLGPGGEGMARATGALPGGRGGALELRWKDRAELDRDTEIAFELLAGEVARAETRLRRREASRFSPAGLAAAPAGVRATRS
ncbi:MAG: undecaprenyl/decaprenyl-phosphate alpha-N-acetylglucosaminyl 1-phosphate transferase [Anaeromyxobacteraceae bacterium]|nr:undecaprenyl/decaprenyl-phosphate alpha-N-acetylglucosaminyl 1-phosphate transferase [Anaeromyxobacteraceae bacterium]